MPRRERTGTQHGGSSTPSSAKQLHNGYSPMFAFRHRSGASQLGAVRRPLRMGRLVAKRRCRRGGWSTIRIDGHVGHIHGALSGRELARMECEGRCRATPRVGYRRQPASIRRPRRHTSLKTVQLPQLPAGLNPNHVVVGVVPVGGPLARESQWVSCARVRGDTTHPRRDLARIGQRLERAVDDIDP